MVLDSNGVRAVGYAVVAVAAAVAGWKERDRARSEPGLWASFWFLTAALFLVMALGRASDAAGLIADLGRREAVASGWYDSRWAFQGLAVGVIALVWFVLVFAALWRVPGRRWRYLPAAVVTTTVVCFAGVRLLSLHHVDALLYRRRFAGAELGELAELTLLVVALVITLRHARAPHHRRAAPTIGDAGGHGRTTVQRRGPGPERV